VKKTFLLALVALSIVGCSRGAPAPPAPRASASVPTSNVPVASAPSAQASAAPDASTTPDVPLVETKEWPFHKWDRAEAVLYNQLPYDDGIPLRVYDPEHGWSKNIADRKSIDEAQAKKAIGWVIQTRGEMELSKCPFPRHAVVLYAGNTPVGTANVCFQCGDILVWPHIDPPPKEWTEADLKKRERKMPAYKRVFPLWRKFFEEELKFPIKQFG
jgi:hypothetical protein